MNSISILEKTEMLPEQIKRILLEERLYRQAIRRSAGDRIGHDARALRIVEIQEALAELRSEVYSGQDE